MSSLRDRLRHDTALKHECVDRAYSSLDLARPDGMRTLLQTQLSVLTSVRCRSGRHAAEAADLGSCMATALEADLRDLGGQLAAPIGARWLDATAILYMLLGSSLGAQVLRRRWLETTDPTVAVASRYLRLTPLHGAWRELCHELAQRSAEGTEADRIVRDATEIFDLHLTALVGRTSLPEGAAYV